MQDSFDLRYGDIILIEFSPTSGHEQAGKRPAIIVSGNEYNERSYMKFVAPLTTTARDFPTNIHLPQGEEEVYGDVLVDQVRSLDLANRTYKKIGHLSDQRMTQISNVIKLIFAV